MEEGLPLKPVEVSTKFQSSLTHIYDYRLNVFGYMNLRSLSFSFKFILCFDKNSVFLHP